MSNNKSGDFAEIWFQECPVAMLILDDRGRIYRINRALQELIGIDPVELLGQDAETLSHPQLQGLFEHSGELEISDLERDGRRYLCQTRELPSSGGMVLHAYQDLSNQLRLQEENDRLQQQINELAITDQLTGMANSRTLNRSLNAQVTRSRRYHNPLSLAVVEIGQTDQEETPEDEVILAVSRFLRDRLRWVDMIARWNEHQFVLILPETNMEDGRQLLDKIQQGFSDSELRDGGAQGNVRLHIGLAEWQKGNDARILMKRAMEALAAEKKADMSMLA
jgi:diguanylate cyclase (GGDEF)-like protein/PAS domain S-box-containing protein